MKFRFIRLTEHSKFEYTPRYYNPEEEEREARRATSLSDQRVQQDSPDAYKKRLSQAFQRNRREERRSILIRVIVAAVVTIALLYAYMLAQQWAGAVK